MYAISADSPIELASVPQSSIGAPCPMICADEDYLRLAFYLEEDPSGWEGTTVRVLSESEGSGPCALVSFVEAYAHMFGPPNDEAFSGHPLASRGLRPYGAFEVHGSSWLSALERMNAVHPRHHASHFAKYRHFIFSFHDTTFECIAESFTISLHRGSVRSVLLGPENEI